MKNQYIGDIGDYGKYAILRAFAQEGIKVGVNWYLIADDGSTDGFEQTLTTIHHDPVYDEVWIEDTPAYDEEVVVGYECECGEKK